MVSIGDVLAILMLPLPFLQVMVGHWTITLCLTCVQFLRYFLFSSASFCPRVLKRREKDPPYLTASLQYLFYLTAILFCQLAIIDVARAREYIMRALPRLHS